MKKLSFKISIQAGNKSRLCDLRWRKTSSLAAKVFPFQRKRGAFSLSFANARDFPPRSRAGNLASTKAARREEEV